MGEYLQRVSHREHLTREAWERLQWNEPDRHDYYNMRICAEIRAFMQAFGKGKKTITLEEFKIPFTFKTAEDATPQATILPENWPGLQGRRPPRRVTKEDILAIHKAGWKRRIEGAKKPTPT